MIEGKVFRIVIPVVWGIIVAIISLPFYLGLAVPEIGKYFGIDTFGAFMSPLLASFFVSVVLCDRDIKSSLYALVSAAVFLTAFLIFILLLPGMIGAVFFIGTYYIYVGQRIILAFIMFFPSLLIGGVTGRVFGEFFVSDITRAERKQLNKKMREWRDTLEKAIEEKEVQYELESKGKGKGEGRD